MTTHQSDEPSTSWLDVQIERFTTRFITSERPALLTIIVGWGIIVTIYQLLSLSDVNPWQNNLKNLLDYPDLNTNFWLNTGAAFIFWPVSTLVLQLAAFLFQLKLPPLRTALRITGKLWMLLDLVFIVFDITTVILASIGWGAFAKLWHGLGEICAFLVPVIGLGAIEITYRVREKQLLPFSCLIYALFIMTLLAMLIVLVILFP